MEDTDVTQWRKASYSNGGGNACVEVGKARDAASVVMVRDTTNRDGGALAFAADAWQAFLATLR